MTTQEILDALAGLEQPDYDVHTIDDAWYSAKAITRALGHPSHENLPSVTAVRVGLSRGMLELHPTEDDKVRIRCYCCFGGDPEKGIVPLEGLKEAIVLLKEHYCPPWPG
jgi:hypothetical protein